MIHTNNIKSSCLTRPFCVYRYTPVPDSVILGSARSNDSSSMYSTDISAVDPLQTPATDFKQIGDARKGQLTSRLDSLLDGGTLTSGVATSVDASGYITALDTMVSAFKAQGNVVLDVKKAKDLILKACDRNPRSEDLWIEASKLFPSKALELLDKGLSYNEASLKLWLARIAATTDKSKRRPQILKALEHNAASIQLWKLLVEQLELTGEAEDTAEMIRVLGQAVQCCPSAKELWIKLARLESRDNSRKILNKARQACPTSHEIWLAAAELEEGHGNAGLVPTLLQRAVKTLEAKGIVMKRDFWIERAAERISDFPVTAASLLHMALPMDLSTNVDEELVAVWLEDARLAIEKRQWSLARMIYEFSLKNFPGNPDIWRAFVSLEKQHGDAEAVTALLEKAVESVPKCIELWISLASQYRSLAQLQKARSILADAWSHNSDSESVALAAIDLELELEDPQKAMTLLRQFKTSLATSSALRKKEIQLVDDVHVRTSLLEEAIKSFPKDQDFCLLLADVYRREPFRDCAKARAIYEDGFKRIPSSEGIWKAAADLEEYEFKSVVKARALYENALRLNHRSEVLLLEAALLEARAGNPALCKSKLARALTICPKSPLLWSQVIQMEPKHGQKSKAMQALKACPKAPSLYKTIGDLFRNDGNEERSKYYYDKAAELEANHG